MYKIVDDRQVRTVAIVLNYNDADTCIKFVRETAAYRVIDRIILVDNQSTDKSISRLCGLKNDKVLLICSDVNKGYAYGNNYGMKYAVETYKNLEHIIITNPDIHVLEEDIRKIIEPIDNGYGMSAGVVYNYNSIGAKKTMASNFGWRLPTYGDMISNCFLLAYKMKRCLLHKSMYLDWDAVKNETLISTEAVPGCFFVLSCKAAKDIDYLDDRTFLFGEETILGWRLKKAGYKAVIVNGTEILHEQSTSINKSIKANAIKEKMRLDSELLYIEHYLRCGKLRLGLYKLIYKIGLYEKSLISKIIFQQ